MEGPDFGAGNGARELGERVLPPTRPENMAISFNGASREGWWRMRQINYRAVTGQRITGRDGEWRWPP